MVTGVGVLLPQAGADPTMIPAECLVSLQGARHLRRMSTYVKLSLAASMLALRDAGVADIAAFCKTCSAVLGTTHGATEYCEQYYRGVIEQGIGSANPLLFAEGVPNAAAARI